MTGLLAAPAPASGPASRPVWGSRRESGLSRHARRGRAGRPRGSGRRPPRARFGARRPAARRGGSGRASSSWPARAASLPRQAAARTPRPRRPPLRSRRPRGARSRRSGARRAGAATRSRLASGGLLAPARRLRASIRSFGLGLGVSTLPRPALDALALGLQLIGQRRLRRSPGSGAGSGAPVGGRLPAAGRGLVGGWDSGFARSGDALAPLRPFDRRPRFGRSGEVGSSLAVRFPSRPSAEGRALGFGEVVRASRRERWEAWPPASPRPEGDRREDMPPLGPRLPPSRAGPPAPPPGKLDRRREIARRALCRPLRSGRFIDRSPP